MPQNAVTVKQVDSPLSQGPHIVKLHRPDLKFHWEKRMRRRAPLESTSQRFMRQPVGHVPILQDSLNATVCLTIDGGYQAPSKVGSAAQKIECPPGTYSTGYALECTSCPIGWSQPKYRSTTCLRCSQGKSTLGNGSRICIGKDCKPEQYLNDTSAEFSEWTCEALSRRCLCDVADEVTWPAVFARAGYYRIPGRAPQHFSPCLKRDACLGAALPPYTSNVSEGCSASQGYMGILCHACLKGFARGGQHDCLPCDSGSLVKIVAGIVLRNCFDLLCMVYDK